MAAAAIFDLDGTLVTFNLDMREWRKVLIELLRRRGFEVSGIELTTPTQQILDAARRQSQGQPGTYESLREEAFAILDSMEVQGASTAAAFPDTLETLRYLSSKKVRLCIVTNSGRKAALETLDRVGIGGFFEFVLTRDDTDSMKPRPEGLAKALSILKLGPGEAFYIGDSPYDIMAAKEAGMRSVSVATGNYTMEKLKAEGADVVLATISELPRLFGV